MVYRILSKMRTGHVDKWAAQWTFDGMHTSAPGIGAEDVSMDLAMRLEHVIAHACVVAGGFIDLRRAFDRFWRQHVYFIDIIAGAPHDGLCFFLM